LFVISSASSQTTEHIFEVTFKKRSIGNLFATQKIDKNKTILDLRTNTKVDLIAFSVYVESEVKVVKENGVLIYSECYRNANRGTESIVAEIKKVGPKSYQVKRNGEEFKIEGKTISYCIVDLYFEEPSKQVEVFSDMYAEFLKIEEISPHKYKLSSPKSKDTYYTYENGELTTVEVETPVGMAVSKRTK
jgi:hypothetical protein